LLQVQVLDEIDTEIPQGCDVEAWRETVPVTVDGALHRRIVRTDSDDLSALQPGGARDIWSRFTLLPERSGLVEYRMPAGAQQEDVSGSNGGVLRPGTFLHRVDGHHLTQRQVPDATQSGEIEHDTPGHESRHLVDTRPGNAEVAHCLAASP